MARAKSPGKQKRGKERSVVKARTPDELIPPLPDVVDSSVSTEALDSKALTPVDPLTTYLNEIRRYPLLTPEQERELAIRYRETGDPKLAEILITSNLRFVVKVAAEYSKFGARLIDLIQEGNVGLMQAVRDFNPYKGVRLITYAVWWIRGYIQEYLMKQYSLVRIGTTQNQRKLFYQLQKHQKELAQSEGGSDLALLSSRLGIPEKEIETMQQRLQSRDVSLNQPVDDESRSSLLDFQSAKDDIPIDEKIGQREEIDQLHQKLERVRADLSERETFLLENRLLADEPLTLQEIGDKWGITREAVRQMEARLLSKIKSTYE